jgi:Protein of unknown function (DUF1631)
MQPQRLEVLIAAIDDLERRLSGVTAGGEGSLSDRDLVEVLGAVGRRYAGACQSGAWEEQRLQLDEEVQQQVRGGARPLSIRQAAMLQLTETLFRFIEYSCGLHLHVYAAVQGLQVGIAATLLSAPALLADPEQPHQRYLERLVLSLRGYDQHAGRRARNLVGGAGRGVIGLLHGSPMDGEACRAAERAFLDLLQSYDRESQIYDKSIISKEQGQAAREDARCIVNREIFAAVGGRPLPELLLRFLREVWSKYLYVTYLREGMDSEAWREGVGAVAVLVRSLSIRHPEELFQFYQQGLSRAMALLRSGAESIHQDTLLTQEVLQLLDRVYMQIMQGEEPDFATLQEMPTDAASLGGGRGEPGPADRQALEGLRLGDWYLIRQGTQEIRGRLIQKEGALGYCLFANYSGIKAARLEAAGLAKALAAGVLQPLDIRPVMDRGLDLAVGQLEAHVPRLEAKVRLVEQERERLRAEAREAERLRQAREQAQQAERAEQERARARAEEAARLARLRERVRRDEEVIREQEQRAAEERVRQVAQGRDQAQRRQEEQALVGALAEVQRLQPGGWLELIGANDAKRVCKLGLKIKSSQKMIFIDRLGQKVAEMLPPELAARMVEGSARIVDYGVAFDDTLGSLILDRSEKIHVE